MSHEFRTPLNSIVGLCRLLLDGLDGQLTPEQDRQITYIYRSAQNLNDMVNDLLDLAKIEAGKSEVRPVAFHVSDFFAALRGIFRPMLTNPAVNLVFEDASLLPLVYTDEGKLSQILRNFISNALKFTEAGEVRVAAQFNPLDQTIIFSVKDTGIGISPEGIKKLFREYSQLDNVLQTKSKGTGLGLALSQKLAELLEGSVGVESEVGVGSNFHAVIPIRYGEKEWEQSMALPAEINDSRKKVLIIDDDEPSRYLVRTWLSDSEIDVYEAKDGFEGQKFAAEIKPDLVVLDLNMPGLDGFDLLKQLRLVSTVPVLIHTAKILTEEERRFLQNNSSGILSKATARREDAIFTVKEILFRRTTHERN